MGEILRKAESELEGLEYDVSLRQCSLLAADRL